VSSTQLLYQSSPYQSAVLLVTGPFVDKLLTKRDVFAFNYTVQIVVSDPVREHPINPTT
jgi:solute carrier family 35, member E3